VATTSEAAAVATILLFVMVGMNRRTDGFVWDAPPAVRKRVGGSRIGAATTTTRSSALFGTESTGTTVEICVSPACAADGAEGVLSKLRALESSSPEHNSVGFARGVCCSLCGNGPVARDTGSGKTHRKLTSNQKILGLLSLDAENLDPDQEAVLEAIDACLEGDKALQRKNYQGAMQHYANGIGGGMNAAIALSKREESGSEDAPVSLQWVIKALCGEAEATLRSGDAPGAVVPAATAFQLSKKRSVESLEILQEAYQSTKKENEELDALETLFELYEKQEEDESKLPRARRKRQTPMEKNKRRTLGFRLSRLQSTIKK